MRITFLGSSHGVPEANQRCTSMMLEVGGNVYFVDMGVMVIEDLVTRGISVDSVKGVFITHMHGDHSNGLVSFVDLCSWYFKTADPVICVPKIAAKEAIEGWLSVNTTKPRELQYREVQEGVIFDDGVIKVTAIRTKHCDVSYSYIIEAEGKTVLFTGDLNKDPETDFPEIASSLQLDLLVGEAAHFDVERYEPLFKECDIKQVVIGHTAPWNVPHIRNLIKKMPDLPIKMATDGLEISL